MIQPWNKAWNIKMFCVFNFIFSCEGMWNEIKVDSVLTRLLFYSCIKKFKSKLRYWKHFFYYCILEDFNILSLRVNAYCQILFVALQIYQAYQSILLAKFAVMTIYDKWRKDFTSKLMIVPQGPEQFKSFLC